jgi:hypothetical protein
VLQSSGHLVSDNGKKLQILGIKGIGLFTVERDAPDDLSLNGQGQGEIRLQRSLWVHIQSGSQFPFFNLDIDPIHIDLLSSEDRPYFSDILLHILGKGLGTGFFLIQVENGTLFPEDGKTGKIEEIGKIVSSRLNDLFELEVHADGIDGGAKNIQVLKDEPQGVLLPKD